MHSDHIEARGGSPVQGRRNRVTGAATAAALLLTGSLVGWSASGTPADANTAERAARPAVLDPVAGSRDSYAPIVEQSAPAVVTIRSERVVSRVSQQLPDHPFFRDFFGDRLDPRRRQPERREGGLGSGVVVRADGHILTNHHVIDGADKVVVELTDGRSLPAKVIGSDPASDLAVLKVDATNLHALPVGDSDTVRVGDVVLALGNPLGVGQTVTMGIVSAKGRATGAGDGSFEDFIQTDAPINRGNSGGALVNTRGELVGINSQILSTTGGSIGIGFAIPANMAQNVMAQLIDHGKVRRGMLGVTIQPVTSEIARSLGLTQAQGAIVSAVQDGSPAEKAGVRRGDVITAVNGEAVKDNNALRNEIAQTLPGSQVKLTLLRDGKTQTVNVTLAELQASSGNGNDEAGDGSRPGATGFGMSVEPLTGARARELGVSASAGVLVTSVEAGGRAAAAGLRSGDVIEEVDGRPVATVEALRSALKAGDRPALLYVHRGDSRVFVTLERASE